MKKRKLVIDCERMKYPHTGLYYYCLHLGNALAALIDKEKESLSYYVRNCSTLYFGNDAQYIVQHSLDKFYMPVKDTDVWHTTYQATNYFPFRKKSKVVFTIHDLNVVHENNVSPAKIKKELAKIQKRIYRADHIIAISAFTLHDIHKHLNVGNTPITVIHNGCNFSKINTPQPPAIVAEQPFIFTLGTINSKKNFHVLPCLVANTQKKLYIAGVVDNEAYKQLIIEEAQKFGVENQVVFLGPISENDKQWYMQHCEAFVFPSIAEGFGLPVIEAMYFGVPVILSTLTALPEIGGDVAYYFNSFEPQQMQADYQQALSAYNNDPTAPQKIMERATQFSWEEAAKKYLEVYRSLY
ncbi:glycosyltransferase family 4 protein [Ferruginibacter yonginensis]|uniref:Glycosyltransferase family 4 protein n=1 Tax=Ferruginibacter yonginensis TaxID=1310416 RepID=A0ABV8QS37_9BACT